MNNIILERKLLNNPVLLIGLVVVLVVIAVVAIILCIKAPKMIAKAKAKKAAKAEAEKARAEKFSKDLDYDAKLFEQRKEVHTNEGTATETKNVIDQLQHKSDVTTKDEFKHKEQVKIDEAKTKDVISVLQGGIASSNANPTTNYLKDKKEKEENDKKTENQINESKDVLSILQGNKYSAQKIESTSEKKKK